MSKNKIIHQASNRVDRQFTTCGATKIWGEYSTSPLEVNCLNCASLLAFTDQPTKKTQRWLERFEELKQVE